LNYFLLGIVYTSIALYKDFNGWKEYVKGHWWVLVLLAFCDVEANFVVVLAYQFTSITSVMLLDCFTIPCVMVISFFLFKERFHFAQVSAVGVCILGLVILVFSDALQESDSPSGDKVIFGDVLVLSASVLYAISNTGQQYQVERHSHIQFLSLLGCFGSMISATQVLVLELDSLKSIEWNWQIVVLIVGFGLSLFALYSMTPFMLRLSSATLMNLSYLTSDAYSLIAGIVLFDYVPSWLYFMSLIVIISGLIVYNVVPDTKHKKEAQQPQHEPYP